MYRNRTEAGEILAKALEKYRHDDVVILAVPRGGVPVAFPIAKKFGCPLDLVLIKKIGHPLYREYAIGAVGLENRILEPYPGVTEKYVEEETGRIRERLGKMYTQFRGEKPPEPLGGRTVIVVDDGIATGRTLASAVDLIKKSEPEKLIIAVPVASDHAISSLSVQVDEIICPLVPQILYGVGFYYEDFTQTTDAEVKKYLDDLEQINSHGYEKSS